MRPKEQAIKAYKYLEITIKRSLKEAEIWIHRLAVRTLRTLLGYLGSGFSVELLETLGANERFFELLEALKVNEKFISAT